MAYYIRNLTPEPNPVSPSLVEKAVQPHGGSVIGDLNTSTWNQLVISNSAGQEICVIERNEVSAGSLAEEEIAEFQAEIADCLPSSAPKWLRSYLESVRTIYAFQVLSGVDVGNGWEILGSVRQEVLNSVGGIVQADGEGFSNEEGYHILWQFSDDVSGDWWMAVLKSGEWHRFKMDLGNQAYRDAFSAGEIPAGAERG